jgi:hypothetical protein
MAVSDKHVSKVNRARAEIAIKAKKYQLESWAKTGIPWLATPEGELARDSTGELQLDYFPRNIAEFCRWDGTQNCDYVRATLTTIAFTNRSTLIETHGELQKELKQLFRDLTHAAAMQLSGTNKSNQLRQLQDKINFLSSILSKQETEITQMQIKEDSLKAKLSQSEIALANSAEYYDNSVAALEKQVAELTASLRKIVPLKIEP